MVKEWTRKERKEHLAEKYRSLKSKVLVLAAMIVVFFLLLWGISHSVRTANTELLAVFVIALIAFLPLAVFLIDMFWFEFQ